MNTTQGLMFDKMRNYVPRVAGQKVTSSWSKTMTIRAYVGGGGYRFDGELVSPETNVFVDWFGRLKSNEALTTDPEEVFYNQYRRKHVQVFRCGAPASVWQEPVVVPIEDPQDPATNIVVSRVNPVLNCFGLEQKPGYPHEIMSRDYHLWRTCATKVSASFTIGNKQYTSDYFDPTRFKLVTGIFFPKDPSSIVDPSSPEDMANYSPSKQFATQVLNLPLESLRIQSGVTVTNFTKRKLRKTIFVPVEKLNTARLQNMWKYRQPFPGTNTETHRVTFPTKPQYTTLSVQTVQFDGATEDLSVPFYPVNPSATSEYAIDMQMTPLVWFMIYDMGGMDAPTPTTPTSYGQAVQIHANFTETRYNVYSEPELFIRTQNWVVGQSSTGNTGLLPERARVYPRTAVVDLSLGSADHLRDDTAYNPAGTTGTTITNNNQQNMDVSFALLA